MGISMKSTSGKILASVALIGTAAAVAGMGTYGAFTATTSASQKVDTGTVTIALGANGGVNNLNVAAAGVLPGDKIERIVDLSNTGNSELNTVSLSTTAVDAATLLTTDATKGLQLTIDKCSVAWTAPASGGSYTCPAPATTTPVLGSRPVIGAFQPLTNLASLTAAGSDKLRVTVTLPASADDTFQGKTNTVKFTFDATQRTATTK